MYPEQRIAMLVSRKNGVVSVCTGIYIVCAEVAAPARARTIAAWHIGRGLK
jgi:hypothetical protein